MNLIYKSVFGAKMGRIVHLRWAIVRVLTLAVIASIEPLSAAERKTEQGTSEPPATIPTPSPATSGDAAHADPFAGWETPRAVLFLTGRQYGYIEPCGCTGLANQKGGLARRYSLLTQLEQQRKWPVVPLDVGNQVRRFGRQAEIQFASTIEALRQMHYEAVGLGPDDLKLSLEELIAVAVAVPNGKGAPFVSANVNFVGFIEQQYRIVEKNGIRFGITAVLGDSYTPQLNDKTITVTPVAKALPPVIAEMQKAKCHVMVLLAHATDAESQELARKYPHFQLVVTSAGAGEPANLIQQVKGARGGMIQVGTKGMYVGVVGFYGDPQKLQVRYARVPLDARYPDAPPMMESLAAYQQQLKAQGLEGLGIQPVTHPSEHTFVGSAACADCHEEASTVWQNSAHAHATESLQHPRERSDIPRHHDPECLSCHVTGWNPQEYFPYASGFLDLEQSKHLHGNGCENCHGPGSAHVAAESGQVNASDAEKLKLQKQMKATLSAEQCMNCHDLDNSPDFHADGAFEKYWKEIAHGKK